MTAPIQSLSLFSLWDRCSEYLSDELPSQQFNTWIKPLSVVEGDCSAADAPEQKLVLAAPNRFIRDWVSDKFQMRLDEFARLFSDGQISSVVLQVANASPSFLRDVSASPEPARASTSEAIAAAPFEAGPDLSLVASTAPVPAAAIERPSPAAAQRDDFGLAGRTSAFDTADVQAQANLTESEAIFAKADSSWAEELSQPAPPPVEPESSSDLTPKLAFEGDEQALLNSSARLDLDSADTERWSGQELAATEERAPEPARARHQNNIIERYRFDNFVEGKSNQLARAAAIQVVENPSGSYNPLFLYGGVGLGKTHLMHAIGNEIKRRKPGAKVVYLHSERFVGDMVKALQLNAINDFKRYYRSVDALLIDDIQFFANKERSQEEFFHTFNALLEGGHQMVFSCDRYPKSINGVEERLKSRFGWGLTVQIEAPELETRVAILNRKAEQENIQIPNDAAFFLANKVRANVRELEGALKRVNANAEFLKAPITIDLIKESLKDLLALQDKMVSIDNIQRTVAEYYKIKIADLHSKRRNRSVARPRQVAMALAKELTNHSLPEIGDAFGGRDHTTVLHACRKIKDLRDSTADLSEDYHNLIRLLST